MKPTRTTAERRRRRNARRIRDDANLPRQGGTVSVLCRDCQRPIISRAAPGVAWPALREIVPLVIAGDIDRASRLIEQHPAGRFVSLHGVFSEMTGGVWVDSVGSAIAGERLQRDRWSLPHPAGVNGDAADWCVSGQPTIIEHHCQTDTGRVSDQSTRLEPVELFHLIERVEQAIARGYGRVTL